MLYRLFRCVANHSLHGHLDAALHSSVRHGCRQEICMKATQTNMEESERDTERGTFEKDKDSEQPRQNEELLPQKKGYFCHMDTLWIWKVWHGPENRTLQIIIIIIIIINMWSFYITIYSLNLQKIIGVTLVLLDRTRTMLLEIHIYFLIALRSNHHESVCHARDPIKKWSKLSFWHLRCVDWFTTTTHALSNMKKTFHLKKLLVALEQYIELNFFFFSL